jgi:hypothetical protein
LLSHREIAMTYRHMLAAALAGLALAVGAGAPAPAAEHEEVNAPRFFNGVVAPEEVGPGIDRIHGSISGGDQGDLYKLVFDVGGLLAIRGRGTTGPLLPTLFLFDAAGAGIFADVGGVAADARIDITIAPGTYYIGIGDHPLNAVDTDGTIWDGTIAVGSAPPAGFGTLDLLDQTGTAVSSGNYRIFLSMATAGVAVPEPAALAILGVGFAAFYTIRRRKRA